MMTIEEVKALLYNSLKDTDCFKDDRFDIKHIIRYEEEDDEISYFSGILVIIDTDETVYPTLSDDVADANNVVMKILCSSWLKTRWIKIISCNTHLINSNINKVKGLAETLKPEEFILFPDNLLMISDTIMENMSLNELIKQCTIYNVPDHFFHEVYSRLHKSNIDIQ